MGHALAWQKNIPIAILWVLASIFLVFVGVILGYSFTVGLGLMALIGSAAVIWWKPEVGVYLSLIAIPFDRLGKISAESGLTAAKILVTLTLLIWAFKALVNRDRQVLTNVISSPLTILALLFLFFSFVSLANAVNVPFGLSQFIRRASQVVFFFLLIDVLFDKEVFWRSLWIYLIGSFLASWTGIYELLFNQSVLSAAELRNAHVFNLQTLGVRIKGPQGDAGFHAVAMVLPALLSVLMMTQARSRILKGALLAFFLVFFINIVGTASRAGIGALAIGLVVFWLFYPFKRKGLVLLVASGVMAGGFLIAGVLNPEIFTERLFGVAGGSTVKWRLAFIEMAFSMIRDHPILGVGTAQFPIMYYRYAVPAAPAKAMFTHNSFLQVWAENGPVAIVVYALIYVVAIRQLYLVIRNTAAARAKAIAVTLLASVMGLAFFAATTQSLELEVYWLLFAWAVVAYRLSQQEPTVADEKLTLEASGG